MEKTTSHRSHVPSLIETLESRTFLSVSPALVDSPAPVEQSAVVRDVKTVKPVTTTKLTVDAGTLGQAITFTVTVKTAASLGSPAGTVNITDVPSRGQSANTFSATLVAGTSTNAKYAISTATYTIPGGAGGAADYFGAHHDSATYVPGGSLLASTGRTTYTVKMPHYKNLGHGLKVATVGAGSGSTTLQAGDTANMLYTGFVVRGGTMFQDSDQGGGAPFPYTVEVPPPNENVIPGFDQGAVGMEVGETRVISIPAALGYGANPPGGSGIPVNANLIFLITLASIG